MTFNIGDQVSVLDEAINGVVVSVKNKEVGIETEDGFMMTFFVNELIKVNNSSNLMNSIRSFNSGEIKKEKEIPKPRNFVKERKEKREVGVPEFDLHIEKLVPNKRGMSNFDILTLQSETAKRHLDFAIRNRIPKIVFIHGVGEGVLKAELDFLFGRYDSISFQDANYQKYGLGATEVYIKQNNK
jgi:dsDNA-specific endonuclease/ATPase MutS2